MHTLLTDAEPVGAANPLLEPSPGLMVWTLVTFGITLFILKKKVFGPIGQIITKRRDTIAENIDEAERSRDEATAVLEDYKARLTDAQREAEQLREQGRKEGERQKAEIITQAQAQRERTVADAEAQIEAQARAAAGGVRDDVCRRCGSCRCVCHTTKDGAQCDCRRLGQRRRHLRSRLHLLSWGLVSP